MVRRVILDFVAFLALVALFASPTAAQTPFGGYPGARMGGFYMHNFYLPPAPASSPWYPSWHPDGKRLAFSMAGSIWEVDIATGVATELVAGPSYYSSPNYSPDGRWLVYTADDHGRSINLEILNTATGGTHSLTEGVSLHLQNQLSHFAQHPR